MYRGAEIFLNKRVIFKGFKNNASPNNKICFNVSYFMPVQMKLASQNSYFQHHCFIIILLFSVTFCISEVESDQSD